MMKKNLLFAASILAVSGFLAACGTSETTEETPETAPEDTFEEATEEEGAENVPAEDVTEEENEDTETGTEENNDAENAEEDASEDSASSIETEGTLTTSDEQAYGMYILPGFELTSEEPGRDILYMTENDAVFMRIETFTPEDLDFAYAEDTMLETLQAVNEDAEVTEAGALDAPEITSSSVHEVMSDEGKVTGATFEKENIIVRLTIFDTDMANATEDFIEMGQTIERSE